METKTLPIEACELKAAFNDDEWAVEGYASVWDSVDKMGDTVQRGAFAESLQKTMPIMRYEHLRFITPGEWTKAVEDEKGLRVSGFLTRDHSWAKDLRASMRHGTVRGLSIGFTAVEQKSTPKGRLLQKVFLKEVSFTADPMEPLAAVESWKSDIGSLESLSDIELFLRDSGVFSKSMATALTSRLKAIVLSDSEAEREVTQREQATELKTIANRYQLRILQLTQSQGV